MQYLALTVPGESPIIPPGGVPQGSLQTASGGFSGGSLTIIFIINLLSWAAVILCLGYLIYGGYRWMTSGGDPEKKVMARNTIIYAIVGLFIVFSSYIILHILGAFFGINFFTI